MKTPLGRLSFLLLGWALAVSVAGRFQFLLFLPPWAVPILVAGLTIGLTRLLDGWLQPAVAELGVRRIVAVHLIRFVGAAFLWMQLQGRLPAEFAHRAGWGDIASAIGAGILLLWPAGRTFNRLLFAWNIFGALDLVVAMGTAGWFNVTQPGSMIEVSRFPLTLVPLFGVPVLLSTHWIMLRQLVRGRDQNDSIGSNGAHFGDRHTIGTQS